MGDTGATGTEQVQGAAWTTKRRMLCAPTWSGQSQVSNAGSSTRTWCPLCLQHPRVPGNCFCLETQQNHHLTGPSRPSPPSACPGRPLEDQHAVSALCFSSVQLQVELSSPFPGEESATAAMSMQNGKVICSRPPELAWHSFPLAQALPATPHHHPPALNPRPLETFLLFMYF